MRKLIFFIASLAFECLKLFPIKKNRVILECDYGKGFYGNILYIYKEIKKQGLPLEIIIPLNKGVKINIKEDKDTKIVRTKGAKHVFYLATSKYWITNNHYYHFLRKRKDTVMINTWHALGAFKKFGIDSAKNQNEVERFRKDSRNIDYLLVSSPEVRTIYSKALNVSEEKIMDMGIPRTDPLFNGEYVHMEREAFINENKFLNDKKVILYAPTFRDDEKEYFNMQLNLRMLKEYFKDEYVVLLKLHPIIRHPYEIEEDLQDFVYDFSKENINNLLIASDILITDYSSVIFEYSILRKPIIFYAYDYDKYKNELRNFYFEYEKFIPSKMSKTTEEVIEEIKKVQQGEYNIDAIESFSKRFCEYTDGKSSERFVNRFLKG